MPINSEKWLAQSRTWKAKNPERRAQLAREYEDRYPEKRRAHVAVCNAVRRGRLIKPTSCVDCGKEATRIEAHHADYSKRLDVAWLCQQCHITRHRWENLMKV